MTTMLSFGLIFLSENCFIYLHMQHYVILSINLQMYLLPPLFSCTNQCFHLSFFVWFIIQHMQLSITFKKSFVIYIYNEHVFPVFLLFFYQYTYPFFPFIITFQLLFMTMNIPAYFMLVFSLLCLYFEICLFVIKW